MFFITRSINNSKTNYCCYVKHILYVTRFSAGNFEDIQACKNSQSNIINLYFIVILNFIFIIYIFLPYLLTFTIFDFWV